MKNRHSFMFGDISVENKERRKQETAGTGKVAAITLSSRRVNHNLLPLGKFLRGVGHSQKHIIKSIRVIPGGTEKGGEPEKARKGGGS